MTERIADYWRRRWLDRRIRSEDVLGQVAKNNLDFPVGHGARVALPSDDFEGVKAFLILAVPAGIENDSYTHDDRDSQLRSRFSPQGRVRDKRINALWRAVPA